jgi:hypothetical protein
MQPVGKLNSDLLSSFGINNSTPSTCPFKQMSLGTYLPNKEKSKEISCLDMAYSAIKEEGAGPVVPGEACWPAGAVAAETRQFARRSV